MFVKTNFILKRLFTNVNSIIYYLLVILEQSDRISLQMLYSAFAFRARAGFLTGGVVVLTVSSFADSALTL